MGGAFILPDVHDAVQGADVGVEEADHARKLLALADDFAERLVKFRHPSRVQGVSAYFVEHENLLSVDLNA